MAPGARILNIQTEKDVANTFSGFKGAIDTIAALSKHHVDAVSLSYGWFEGNYDEAYPGKGPDVIRSQAAGLTTAARNRMTVLSANGDTGATGPDLAGDALYSKQSAAFISTSPLVTAVAGTELHADDHGNRTTPDTVWGEHDGDGFATGGALSGAFTRPSYQDGVRDIVGDHRGNADVSMDGSVASRVWMYTSRYQVLSGQQPGWVRTAGTSAASPLFAGIVADAAARAGQPLGPINTALYQLGRTPASRAAAGIADVTEGCNTTFAVQGHCARTGTDLPSGIGTVGDASRFVPALAAAARH
jgi:subtilase family serine protease